MSYGDVAILEYFRPTEICSEIELCNARGAVMQDTVSKIDEKRVRAELVRVLSSSDFAGSDRHRCFLTYIVEETLAGRANRLKAYNIATAAFNRGADFDPQQDSIVRIEAGRLRRALDHFYLTDGRDHEIQIVVPKGSYVPQFRAAGDPLPDEPHETQPQPATRSPRRAPRILVAPFDQEGENAALPGFAPGFTRQLIGSLARFGNVHVYGAETSEQYGHRVRMDRERSPLTIDYVLSGSVSLWEDGFAVDLLLQDTESLRFIWTERFVRKLAPESILVLRDEVAAIVAQTLGQPYGVLFSQALDDEGKASETLDGYTAVVGFYQYVRNFQKDRLEPARRMLEQAIEQDPAFGEGYACLSQIYSQHARFMSRTPSEGRQHAERAMQLARRALLLAPNSSNAHHALALAYWFAGETTLSLQSYQTARSLNPNDTDLMADMGLRCCLLMDWQNGVPLIEESFRRNPCQAGTYRMGLVLYHFSEGQYREGLRQAEMVNAPDVVYHEIAIAVCAERAGQHEKAQAAIARIARIEGDYSKRVAFDLAARNVHPALAQDLMAALREAGLWHGVPPLDVWRPTSDAAAYPPG
jgi:adenylate cyclase